MIIVCYYLCTGAVPLPEHSASGDSLAWMSRESEDKDYKPNLPEYKLKQPAASRTKRNTRRTIDYRDAVVILEEESDQTGTSETQLTEKSQLRERYREGTREGRHLSTDSVWGSSERSLSSDCWSPNTVQERTKALTEGIEEVKLQLRNIDMAKKEELSMGDMMKMILEMNNRDKEDSRIRMERMEREAKIREEEREERATIREEKRLQDLKDSEERRETRDRRAREEADEREAKLLATLKAAQPAIPQTVHLDNTKLPTMSKGEDLELFIELFETALTVGGVPEDKWVAKLHAALDTDSKLAIKETITNPYSTYAEIKQALVGQSHLTFTAASEAIMTLDQGGVTKLPMRQAVQKLTRLFEKATAEATTIREACLYSAVAVARFALNPDAKQYIDVKGTFDCDSFCRSIEEWQRTHTGKPVWDSKNKPLGDRQPARFAPGKKVGSCYHCGKGGHFAYECRSRLAGDRPAAPRLEVPAPTQQPAVKKEQPRGGRPDRDMSEVTCFRCRQQGHISPNCPKRTTPKVRRVLVQEQLIESLGRNEVFGAVGPHRMPITCDTGAEVTVVPEEAVEQEQLTGETCELRSFNDGKSIGKSCVVQISVDGVILTKQAVTQPGKSLGWSVCLSLDLNDQEERQFLMQQITRRAEMTQEEALYIPPEVREGILVSGIPVREARVVKSVKVKSGITNSKEEVPVQAALTEAQQEEVGSESLPTEVVAEVQTATEPLQSTTAEAQTQGSMVGEEVDEVEDEITEQGDKEDNLVAVEEGGVASGGSADREGSRDFPVAAIREGMPREEIAEETKSDGSLRAVLALAEMDKEGFHLTQGLVFRTRLDKFGRPFEQLCIPTTFRRKCLTAAHLNFGHQGRNKMVELLRPYFYWPNLSRSCRDFVKECNRCQTADKTTPKPHSMTARPAVTQPFTDVAIDLVGPFPTATGGFRHMLTCVDTASRWPEAIPVKSITSTVIIRCLTEIFSRNGFPEKLTTDNGSQFVSKKFTTWLRDKGIAHSRATPYHPQGNRVVERLHRTLNAVVLKTIQAKGNWATILPLALYFIRCTPSASTGVSPFLLTHGWEPRTPLQVLYRSWVKSELGGVELTDWILENQERVEHLRDVACSNLLQTSAKRRETWDRRAVDRSFSVGDKVWMRRPGLDLKLQESWIGPYTIKRKNSPVSYSIQTEHRLIPTVHIQQLKEVHTPVPVKKITVVVEDTETDELTHSFASTNIQEQDLSPLQQSQLNEVLGLYSEVLTKEPGLTSHATFDIDTGDAEPIHQRPYSTPVALKESVDQELSWLLQKGYIVPSSSPWASPMVTVRKADGSARLCVDFRRINSLTRQIPFFMPRVEEVIEGVGRARYISKLDLSKGFYQVPLTQEAQPKTAFVCYKGAFQFTRMPFGVKNAPACFQALMRRVLMDLGEFSAPYMDDVIIYSPTWEDHITHIGKVLSTLQQAGLTVNPKKCCWGGRAVEFLGHFIGEGNMSIPQHRTTALANYTKPNTKRGLRAFLGSVGFYRRYLPHLAEFTSTLTPLTSKQAPQRVEWTGEGVSAFRHICDFFCDPPNLCVPLPSDVLSIVSDAGQGYGWSSPSAERWGVVSIRLLLQAAPGGGTPLLRHGAGGPSTRGDGEALLLPPVRERVHSLH